MSGPLASWCLAHTTAPTTTARLVLVCLALKARHDGTNANLTADDLATQSGADVSNIRRALVWLQGHGEIEVVEAGGGRGRETRRRIVIRWCRNDPDCFTCGVLIEQQPQVIHRADQRKAEKPSRQRAGFRDDAEKPSRQRDPSTNRVAYPQENPRVSTAKPSRQRDPLRNGDGPPSGGTVTHPESAAALAPDGAAADGGLSDANRAALAEFYAAERRAKVAKATAQQHQSREPTPATENAIPRPAVQADTARELDPAQQHQRRRHDQRGHKGHRGREPPATCIRSIRTPGSSGTMTPATQGAAHVPHRPADG